MNKPLEEIADLSKMASSLKAKAKRDGDKGQSLMHTMFQSKISDPTLLNPCSGKHILHYDQDLLWWLSDITVQQPSLHCFFIWITNSVLSTKCLFPSLLSTKCLFSKLNQIMSFSQQVEFPEKLSRWYFSTCSYLFRNISFAMEHISAHIA